MSAPRTLRIEEIDLTLTVTNGEGSVDFTYEGYFYSMRVKTPEKNATWTPVITDRDAFLAWESPQGELTGSGSCRLGEPFREKNTITFVGSNGIYSIRLMADHGV